MDESVSHSAIRTFLIADIRGYTRFTMDHGDAAAAQLATRFAELTEQVVAALGGEVIELRGDETLAVFASTRQALRAAVELHRRFVDESSDALPLKAGVGLDAGEAVPVTGGYRGGALNLAARLCSIAGPGEVLATRTVIALSGTMEGLRYSEREPVTLKGYADPVPVIAVSSTDLPDSFAPLVALPDQSVQEAVDLPVGGFLGARPTGRLVARDAEMDHLLAAVDAVESGAGRCVLLAGEPGIGKTRLAQEATLELRDRGFLIAAGSSFEPHQSVPYYPFRDVLTALYGAISTDLRSQVGRLWPYLGRLLPEAGAPVPVRSDSTEEQEWLQRAVVGFVRAAARETPIAVLLDDLHWADEVSLDLVRRLALQTRGDRVLLLSTYRDEDVQRHDALERTLRDLHRTGLLERIVVPGLSQDGTRALIAATLAAEVPEDVAAVVYRQTEGNPFFTQEVLQTLVERGAVSSQNGHWEWREIDEIEVPESVRLVLGERLSRLREKTRELLGAASVLGQTFRFDELQALGDHGEEDVEEALDEAVQRGIIRETGDHYRFHHALIQAALYGDLSGRRKRRLHRAAGEVLEALTEPLRAGREADLAWHFHEGDDRQRALSYSLLAGDAAEAVFAHGEAAQHYRKARDLARGVDDDGHLREALRKLGAVLRLMGRYDAAEEALEEAVQLARQAHDLDGEMEAVLCLLRLAPERGTQDDALRWVEPLLPRLEDFPVSPIKLAFFNAYAYFLVQTAQFDEGLQVAQQTIEMAGALGDEDELARSKVVLGHLLVWHGRGSETRDLLDPVVPYLEDAGNLPDAMRAASLLAQVEWFSGDFRAALRWRERSLRLVRQVGDAAQAVYETCMLGYQHLRLGDMDRAWEEGLQAVTEAREMDQSTIPGSPLGLVATLSWIQGKWDDLARYTDEMISLSDRSDEPWWRRHGEHIMALLDLLEEHPAKALARLEALLVDTQLDVQEQALFLPALAEAYLKTGNLQRAQEVLDVPLALRGREMRGMLTDTLQVQAMLLCTGGDLAGAEAALNDLLRLARSMPYPFAEAQALAEYGHLEEMRGNLTQARERVEGALAIFRRLAAQPFVEQTERGLAQIARETALDANVSVGRGRVNPEEGSNDG